jgi:hypothetical protein
MKKIILILGLLGVIFLVGCSKVSIDNSSSPGELDNFAQCLTEKGVKMYGTEWCSHCKNQKAAFGSSFQYVDYVDCDKNKQACNSADITGYPTWTIEGNNYPGEQQLNNLASLSGCKLP